MATSLVCGIVALGQSLAKHVHARVLPPVHVLTRGARMVERTDRMSIRGIAQAAVLGAVRTLALELPDVSFRLVDLDGDDCDGLIDALLAPDGETEVAVRAGQVHAARLVERAAEELDPDIVSTAGSGNMTLARRGAAGIDGLVWRQAQRRPLGPDDVEIEVRACGLNFRDVMAVSGVLPANAEPTPALEALGLELSGVVTAVGASVRDLAPGAHVIGIGRGALRKRVCWPRLASRPYHSAMRARENSETVTTRAARFSKGGRIAR